MLDILVVRFLMSFSTRPIHVFGLLGLLSFLVGAALLAYLAVVRLLLLQPIAERPLLLLAILLTMLGVQLVTTGLLAELTSRTYYESQDKSIYTVREELGDRRDMQGSSRLSRSASERSESRSASGVGGVDGPGDRECG
jgi:hypothetical protein